MAQSISLERKDDIKARAQMLADMATSLREYEKTKNPVWLEIADEWKRMASVMEERIKTLDYSERDKKRAKLDSIFGV